MKKIEYVDIKATEQVLEVAKPELEKQEDASLPSFTKELPLSKKKKEGSETTTIDYQWGITTEDNIKIKSIEFRKEEQLSDIYRLNIKDGTDTAVLRHKGAIYLIRKTSVDIAKALLSVYKRISGLVENVVGYFQTLFGHVYTISKIEKGTWTFDHGVIDHEVGIRLITPDTLTDKQKARLSDIIIQKISSLHAKNLVLGSFSLKNLLLTNKDSHFTDLRNLRVSKKPSFIIEEFKAAIRYLLSMGIMGHDGVYPAVASYCVANENACREWHKERLGDQAVSNDTYDIANAIESEIYN